MPLAAMLLLDRQLGDLAVRDRVGVRSRGGSGDGEAAYRVAVERDQDPVARVPGAMQAGPPAFGEVVDVHRVDELGRQQTVVALPPRLDLDPCDRDRVVDACDPDPYLRPRLAHRPILASRFATGGVGPAGDVGVKLRVSRGVGARMHQHSAAAATTVTRCYTGQTVLRRTVTDPATLETPTPSEVHTRVRQRLRP